MDGVLLDSMPVWEDAGILYLKEQGREPKPGLTEVLFTKSMLESAEYMREVYELPKSAEEIVQDIIVLIRHYYETKIPMKAGALEFIKRLKEKGIAVTVATSSDRVLAEAGLSRHGILPYVDGIFTCGEAGAGKEKSPAVYLNAQEFMGTKPEETWVFEDVLHGIRTAGKAGFPTAGIYDVSSEDNRELIQKESTIYLGTLTDFERFYRFALKGDRKTALTIAGSDSSGGAGIQADIKTMMANGVYAMSAITALTAQNTIGVAGIFEVTPGFLKQQLDCVFTDIYPDAVKIGMVSNAALIETIADTLVEYQVNNVVVDPVLVSTSGSKLLKDDAIQTLVTRLLPLATVVTPNIPEAELLADMTIHTVEEIEMAAQRIGTKYNCNVLLKGGHAVQDANDFLWQPGRTRWFRTERINNPNTHGTGCTLSSAIASFLARGDDLETAVENGKTYLTAALQAMLDLGKGSGPLDHGFAYFS